MRRSRCLILIPTSARLLIGLLLAISSLQVWAQAAPKSQAGRALGLAYDAAHETTLVGTIQEAVTRHVTGSPAGMHLLVAGTQGVVDAHIGPYLSKETIAALQTGAAVQIVGSKVAVRGKDYLLVRQLIVGGRTVTVRNENGFLVRAGGPRAARSKPEANNGETAQKGSEL